MFQNLLKKEELKQVWECSKKDQETKLAVYKVQFIYK